MTPLFAPRRSSLPALWCLALALGCSGAGENRSESPVPESAAEPTLPEEAGRFAPAQTRLEPRSGIRGQGITRVDACVDCHPDVVAQWSTSAHAFASFSNPVYRVSIDGFRARVGQPTSRFCAGCHDIALLVDGAMDEPIDPADERAHAGVNCRVCHGVSDTRADGNGSYTLGPRPISIPDGDDPASVERHRQAVSVRALGSDLCRTCHRSFVGVDTGNASHLIGMDDAGDWQRSPYAGQGAARVDHGVVKRDCVECHMAKEPASEDERAAKDGAISSHRFLGAHTWLGAMRGDDEQVERVRARLSGVASIDIAAIIARPPVAGDGPVRELRSLADDPAPVALLGGELLFDVVVRNLAVGHRFPGGVKDAQDVWLEVAVTDARGRVLARSGADHTRDPDDVEAHVFRALVADEAGEVLWARQVDQFRAVIVDHTIAPRDVAVVRYAMTVPAEDVALPLSIDAALRHRTRNLILQARACADFQSEQGQAFAKASLEARGVALDACAGQPVTTIAETRAQAGADPAAPSSQGADPGARPRWQRLYEHGMAWNHAVQERLDEGRPSLLAALDELDADAAAQPYERAMVLAALGRLAGRQGRTDEALGWLDRAEALVPGNAALASIRGNALAQVWRWQEAAAPLERAAAAVPGNAGVWADLAVALGSLGKDRDALRASRAGLALEPRQDALLRVQALSLRALDAPLVGPALEAYDRFRAPDRAMDIRFACAAAASFCAREREPVHVHVMQPSTP